MHLGVYSVPGFGVRLLVGGVVEVSVEPYLAGEMFDTHPGVADVEGHEAVGCCLVARDLFGAVLVKPHLHQAFLPLLWVYAYRHEVDGFEKGVGGREGSTVKLIQKSLAEREVGVDGSFADIVIDEPPC